MKKIKVGIIGCGLMGNIHAECFAREKGCELVAFTNRTRAKAERLSRVFGGQTYESDEELLEYSDCDAVVIASPQQSHYQQIMNAVRAGKHIMCEKPVALTSDELSKLEKALNKTRSIFMVAHQMRFHPVIQWVKKNQKKLGRIYHLDLEWALLIKGHQGRCFEDYRSGGFYMELGCHATDLARYFMGDVRDVTARTLRLDPQRVTEDCTHCLLQFENNAIASLFVSANHRGKRQGLLTGRLLGEKGRIEFSIYPYERGFNEAQIILDKGNRVFVPDVEVTKMDREFAPSQSTAYKGFFDVYQQQAKAFAHSIRTGQEPPVAFRDGKIAIEIVLASYQSQSAATQNPHSISSANTALAKETAHPVLK